MISGDDIDALCPAKIEAMKQSVRADLGRASMKRAGCEFTASGLPVFLSNVQALLAYTELLEAGMEAAGTIAADLQRMGAASMSLHEGPAKASETRGQL